MVHAKRQQEYYSAEPAAVPAQPIPADWFLDPADPQAAEKYHDGVHAGLSLEEQATALLAAQEAAEAAESLSGPEAFQQTPVTPLRAVPAATPTHTSEEETTEHSLAGIWSPTTVEGELAWQVDALCAQTDPEAFFPEKGGSTRDAKRVCAACPVKAECLEYALEKDERFGIWGGLSERERRRLRKKAH